MSNEDSRDAYRAGLYGSRTYGGSGGTSNKSFQAGQRSRERQQNKNTGQSSSGSQENKKTGNERAKDRLVELHNRGQGNSTQAQDIKRQLASVDAKADAWNYAENRVASYDEMMGAGDNCP